MTSRVRKSLAYLGAATGRWRERLHRVVLLDAARQVHGEPPAQTTVLESHLALARAARSAGCGRSAGWRRTTAGLDMRDGIDRHISTRVSQNFAQVNRASCTEELTASLAHELTELIAAAHNNALAAQNFVNTQPPELGEIREALTCVLDNVDRAADIIDRIRDHIDKRRELDP